MQTISSRTLISDDTSTHPTSVDETWSLDSLGHWVSNTVGGSTTYNTTNSQNELTSVGSSSETFDNDGNTLTDSSGNTYTYNAWNQMATVTIGDMEVVYSYDALGRRVSMAGPGTGALVAQYYSADGQLIETDPNGDPFATGSVVQSQYVWGLNGPNDLVVADVTGGGDLGIDSAGLNTRIYSINDANHDVMATADTTGAVMLRYMYDPYGTRMGGGGPYDIQVGFQGGIIDPFTGLVHFDARDYNPATGRWMEQDPTGAAYVDAENLYTFDDSNPLGRQAIPILQGVEFDGDPQPPDPLDPNNKTVPQKHHLEIQIDPRDSQTVDISNKDLQQALKDMENDDTEEGIGPDSLIADMLKKSPSLRPELIKASQKAGLSPNAHRRFPQILDPKPA